MIDFDRRTEAFAQPAGLGCGEAECGDERIGFERVKFAGTGGGAEYAAGRGDVPAAAVMAWRHRQPDPAFDFDAEYESEDEIATSDAPEFAKREQSGGERRGRVDHRRHMGVAEVEHIRARGIEKGGRKRIEAFAAPDHGALFDAGKSRERLQRGFDRWLT